MKNLMYVSKNGAIKTMLSTLLSVCTLFLTMNGPAQASGRFNAPEFNAPVGDFIERGDSDDLNVDFIIALTFNKSRKLVNDAEEIGRNATEFFTNALNQNNNNPNITDNNGAVSNSVIIPIGTQADTIIIINENDGDSVAIQR